MAFVSETRVQRDHALPPATLGDRRADLLCNDDVRRTLVATARPLDLQFPTTSDGFEVTGDRAAVLFAERAIQAILERGALSVLSDPAELDRVARDALTKSLQRELAFRLEGLARPIQAMSMAQYAFLQALIGDEERIVFGLGPTGTGKTHLAVAAGVSLLAQEKVKRLVLTRPHVLLAGEVMTPEMRAETSLDDQFVVFDDILHDLLGHEAVDRLRARGEIEYAPVGRMRGRTFNDAFVLIDEAQNMTPAKLRMAATRLGRRSRLAIVGDPQSSDLKSDETNGLVRLLELVEGDDIASIHRFEPTAVIRSRIAGRLNALFAAAA